MSISKELLQLIKDYGEIEDSVTDINPFVCNSLKEIFNACCENKISTTDKLKIDSVVDYLNEKLHIGHWNSIPLTIRRTFYIASFLKGVVLVHMTTISEVLLQEVLKVIDIGILLGAPLNKNSTLLTDSAKYLNAQILKLTNTRNMHIKREKRKLDLDFPEFSTIKAISVDSSILPSLECFLKNYFRSEIPLKIQESIDHWPAVHKWMDMTYLLKIAGERTVPIEIGSQYSDQNWSQKLMTFKNFIEKYYLSKSEGTGYLAQHNLFDQIPELKDDICVPEYCCMGRDLDKEASTLEINAWLGPEGTVSSLHFDPKDNLLAQVYGTKLIILFPPSDSPNLYPHEHDMLSNTSQLNPLNPNLEEFPNFPNTNMYKCLLKSGEMLYMPQKWWHYVIALENSFSVNFWWT